MNTGCSAIAQIVIVLPLCCANAQSANAQHVAAPGQRSSVALTKLAIRAWSTGQGLPQSSVTAVHLATDGALWVGTQQGLARFDGTRFTVFRTDSIPELGTNSISTLATGAAGELWIGTDGGGVIRYANGQFKAVTHRDGLPSDHVRSVVAAPDGTLWVATTGAGLARIKHGRVRVYGAADGLPDPFVLSVGLDGAGMLWVGTRSGLAALRGERFRTWTMRDGLPSNYVNAVIPASGGGVWTGTAKGIARVRGDSVVRTYTVRDGLSSPVVYVLHEDRRGALWIGTNGGGLDRLTDGKVEVLDVAHGLPGDLVWALAEDGTGAMWVGMNGGGLARLSEPRLATLGPAQGLASKIALALLEDRDGALWVATAGKGVTRFAQGAARTFTTRDGLPRDLVTTLAQDSAGRIWFGSPDGGLAHYDGSHVTRLTAAEGVISDNVNVVFVSRTGDIWIGYRGAGLQRLGAKPRLFTARDGLGSSFVNAIAEGADGAVWVATREGVSRVLADRITTIGVAQGLPDRDAMTLLVDDERDLWAGTANGGIALVEHGRALAVSTRQGLLANGIGGIVDDGMGNLWLSSDFGIQRISKAELRGVARGQLARVHPRPLTPADGLLSEEANGGVQPAGLRSRSGIVWFPTMAGAVGIEPRRFDNAGASVRATVDRVATGMASYAPRPGLVLGPNERSIDVAFSVIELASPERLTVQYRLLGLDSSWVRAGTERQAHYAKLPPGEYRFEVRAYRAGDPAGRAGAFAAFTVPLLPWERWEAKVGLLVLIAAGLLAVYRRRVAALHRRNDELRTLIDERTLAEERFRELFENASDAIFTTDLDGQFTTLNTRACELFGLRRDLAIGHSARALLRPRGDSDDTEGEILLDPTRPVCDVMIVGAGGGALTLEMSTRAIMEHGSAVGYQAIARDVTERNRLAEELRQAQRMETVGRLAGGIAHDFNNLLTVIISCAEFAEGSLPVEDDAQKDITEIKKAGLRAADLTRQLLSVSRRQALHPRAMDLVRAVDDMRGMLARIVGEDLTLEIQPGTKEVPLIMADPGQVDQIILNLVVNARDATPGGGAIILGVDHVRVEGGTRQHAAGLAVGMWVRLSVSDTGSGMPAEVLARAFEPFYTTKTAGGGTGLGLSTVYGIVKQTGGEVLVASVVGAGTTFEVFFPIAAAAPATEPMDARRLSDASPGGRVLLVEDELAVRKVAESALLRAGYSVIAAPDGAAALAVLDRDPDIDLLVTDLIMPDMNGIELANAVIARVPRCRVLFVSGYTDDVLASRSALPSGAGFLEKPYLPNTLAQRASALLSS